MVSDLSERKKHAASVQAAEQRADTEMPSDEEILEQIALARSEARDFAAFLCMDPQDIDDVISCPLRPGVGLDLDMDEEDDDDPAVVLPSPDPDPDDMALLRVSQDWSGGGEYEDFPPKGPFVLHTKDNGVKVPIKKTTLCWLLSSGTSRLSSDRLHRVCEPMPTSDNSNQDAEVAMRGAVQKSAVAVGEWCAFRVQGQVRVGRVLCFRYLTGRGRESTYTLPSAPVAVPDGVTARGLGCVCSWFAHAEDGRLTHSNVDRVVPIEHYLRTLDAPQLVQGNLMMSDIVTAYINSLRE